MNKHISTLRPYQNRAIRDTYESMRQNRTTLLQLPTGSGKSHIAASVIEHGLQNGKRIGFLTDRIVLSDQIFDRLYEAGLPVSVLQGNHPMYRPDCPVQICSVQTLARRSRDQWPPVDLWFQDEAHIQYNGVYEIMDTWNNIPWIGLSATPFTTGLGLKWENLVVGATTSELMGLGYLSQYEAYGPSTPNLVNVRRSGGDYATADLEERMNELTGDIVSHWKSFAEGKKTLAFTPTVAYAQHLAEEFESNGINADYVCGKDSDERRSDVLKRYSRGEITVLTNCDVLTRGYDQPDIECGILARPTRSLSLHIQMLGRMLRTAPGKDKALILDHAGNIARLGFPDDDLPTTLNTQEQGVSSTDTPNQEEPQPWNCPECHHLVPPRTHQCPVCGHTARRPSRVEVKAGVLTRLEKGGSDASKQTVYSMLNCIAQDKGYKPGWTANKYRAIFGVWPRKMKNTILTPTPELRSWITSQNIRYANRRNA
jgi:superfamily II DNA or RNA helicase